MQVRLSRFVSFCILLTFILGACFNPTTNLPILSIILGASNDERGILLNQGEDRDTLPVNQTGNPVDDTRTSGNGQVLDSPYDSTTRDYYLQFNVDDAQLRGGVPTLHVRVEVDYLDTGLDSFSLQYDSFSNRFASGGSVTKTDTNTFKTARFNLCDANFDNRVNGGDFRIADNGDGAEFIRAVRVIGLRPPGAQPILVNNFGANPLDNRPDSDAIQAALDSSCSGDRIVFNSGGNNPSYRGYLIDKTLFLTGTFPKQNMSFTSSDPNDHALLRATENLKGYVVRLYSRSRFTEAGYEPGMIDNIDFGNIDVDGGRELRQCSGPGLNPNNRSDGLNDDWGSWLPRECRVTDPPDSWCMPGNIAMDGGTDPNDITQNYTDNPDIWTTGVVVHDVVDQQAECGSALTFFSAAGTIRNVTIDTAGDHNHNSPSCPFTDNDGDLEGWSDGITLSGPAHSVQHNTIINASDVGIVFFGGKNTIISNNTVISNQVNDGNYGIFAGIAIHPWILGDISGTQVSGNRVENSGSMTCGGMHVGINIGPHMWGGACQPRESTLAEYGNNGPCSGTTIPDQMTVAPCTGGACQVWAYLSEGSTFTMEDNSVTGAHINYLVEGFKILGQFIDQNNISQTPQLSDWGAARSGCNGITWGALDKVAYDPILRGYTNEASLTLPGLINNLVIYCER